jgi:hypothetical protein
MEVAAIMGHLNGWILDFGDFPGIIGKYSSSAGFSSIKDFSDALMGSHSHEMVVSFMAMVAVLLVLQFGYQEIQKAPRIVVNIGLAMVAIGIVATIVVYIAAGFVNWGPPN